MIKLVDPAPLWKNRRTGVVELEAMSPDLLTDDMKQLQVALDCVCNQMMLEAACLVASAVSTPAALALTRRP